MSTADVEKLKKMEVVVRRQKRGPGARVEVETNLYNVTDKEYLEWLIKQIKGLHCHNRLRFRLETTKIIDALKLLRIK